MFKQPFSFDGRIRRTEYGLSLLIYIISLGVVSVLAETSDILGLALIPAIWFMLAQNTKRCHDMGKSGWWQLIPFYVVALLFIEGHKGTNKYGEDSKLDSGVIEKDPTSKFCVACGSKQKTDAHFCQNCGSKN